MAPVAPAEACHPAPHPPQSTLRRRRGHARRGARDLGGGRAGQVDAEPRLRVAALVAVAAALPFLRGLCLGHSFYFRDLSRHFYPLRRFVVEGLRQGEVRFWNPYEHAGEMLSLPPVSYPLDLLQVLWPNEAGFTLLLALHVPLAALSFFALARGLGLGRLAAAGGGLAYALGGFALSCLNLYVYLQAVAWAPLLVLGLWRAAARSRNWVLWSPLAVAVAVSTTGLEIVAQALVIGALLGSRAPGPPGRVGRLLVTVGLGLALAAPTLLVLADAGASSERAAGFPTDVVLSHSVHPLTFAQVLVANFYGDVHDLTQVYWGQNFFPLGFPYFLSLYLGAAALACAGVGATTRQPCARIVALMLGAAVWICLGRWGGWTPVLEALPTLRILRFPSKAFFTAHTCVALLIAFGLQELARGEARAWCRQAAWCLSLGTLLLSLPLVPLVAPEAWRWFVAGFFPPHLPPEGRQLASRIIFSDAAVGGGLAVATAVLAWLAHGGRLRPGVAAALTAGLMWIDLLRAGAGLNPMVTPAFFEASPEARALLPELRDGRIFTCKAEYSRSLMAGRAALAARGQSHEAWSFAAFAEIFEPAYNLRYRLRSAFGEDRTMLVPRARVLSPQLAACRSFDGLVAALRAAGVTHVLSFDPLEHEALRAAARLTPARLGGLAVHVYRLEGAAPLLSLERLSGAGSAVGRILGATLSPGRSEIEVETEQPARLVEREASASGWSARVNGEPAAVEVAGDPGYRSVRLPRGRSRVVLRYRPPHLDLGLATAGLSALALGALGWRDSLAARRRS